MNNIWFIRTDKDGWNDFDISEDSPFIYSMHGICGNQEYQKVQDYKKNVFPKLLVSGHNLRNFVREVKQDLISIGQFGGEEIGKKQCDLFIYYWIAVMQIDDIVFIRNKKQEVFICQVTGYVLENTFDKFGIFQRPVKILKKISETDAERQKLTTIWHRTLGRRTLEINRRHDTRDFIINYLETI